jgi:hypothetical protein
LVIRAGWGEGEQVADGRWLHARALPWPAPARRGIGARRPGRDRSAALRPQERLAALLGVRSTALMCEELALRARQDLEQHRLGHAALELDHALQVAPRELGAEQRQDLALRIAELEQLHAGVKAQARAALPTGEDAPGEMLAAGLDEEALTHALERLEAVLRARTAAGFS